MAEPLFDNTVPVGEALVAAMADAGIDAVVGIPGGLTGPIWKALHNHPTIRALLVREESLGSYLAEAYGRLTGRPIVVMGQGEWIIGNAAAGYMEALMGSSPMVIVTEMSDGGALAHHGPYQGGTGDYGNWDARKALEGFTKRVIVAHHPAQAVQQLQLAIKHATTGDPGPVGLILSSAALKGTVGPEVRPRVYSSRGYLSVQPPALDGADIEATLEALAQAAHPVLLAGNGVRVAGACPALAAAANRLGIPVVTTAQGKGVFDETHHLARGVIGAFGWPEANDTIAQADVIIAIGTKLGTIDTIDENDALIDPRRQRIFQVDVEPLNVGWTTPVERAILADAGAFLRALADAPSRSVRADVVGPASPLETDDPISPSVVPPFPPQTTIGLLNRLLPANSIVTCDAGENRLFMMRWFRNRRPGGYLQPASGGGMGHAVPAALGAKLVYPGEPVIAVCGDGGFSMALHGLMSARELDLPIGVVVLNNQALGWVLHGMGSKAVAAEFADFDYASIARAMGCDGVRPQSFAALEEAIASLADLRRPLVIDAPTGMATTFRDILDPIDQRRSNSGYVE